MASLVPFKGICCAPQEQGSSLLPFPGSKYLDIGWKSSSCEIFWAAFFQKGRAGCLENSWFSRRLSCPDSGHDEAAAIFISEFQVVPLVLIDDMHDRAAQG
jgi:hypothetical protein